MKLIAIYNPDSFAVDERIDLLRSAASELGIDMFLVSILDDNTEVVDALLKEEHALIRIGYPTRDKFCMMLNQSSKILKASIYDCYKFTRSFDSLLENLGYSHIKTVKNSSRIAFDIDLENILEYLGGFPIVLKRYGMSKGEGVFKVHDLPELVHMVDDFEKDNYAFCFKEYYPHYAQGRLITVGGKFVAGHLNLVGEDFRSNVGDASQRRRKRFDFSEDQIAMVEHISEKIAQQFCGFDLLFGDDGTYKICESNTPCNFVMTQRISGVNIAGKIIEYLIAK